jgi:hypothetical protein
LLVFARSAYAESHEQQTVPRMPAYQAQPGLPNPRPIENCIRMLELESNASFEQKFDGFLEKIVGINLLDWAMYPDLLIVEDCKSFFIVSTVNGQRTSGSVLRFIFPRGSNNYDSFSKGEFGEFFQFLD